MNPGGSSGSEPLAATPCSNEQSEKTLSTDKDRVLYNQRREIIITILTKDHRISRSYLGHIHFYTYLTLPGLLHHQPIHPVPPGCHQYPSWVHCQNEQHPSCPELFVHRPSWGDCSPACSPHCNPSLPGLPPDTGHCHTAAALPDSVLPLRGKGLWVCVWGGCGWIGGTIQGIQKKEQRGLWGFIGWYRVWKVKGRRSCWRKPVIALSLQFLSSNWLSMTVIHEANRSKSTNYQTYQWWRLPWSIKR